MKCLFFLLFSFLERQYQKLKNTHLRLSEYKKLCQTRILPLIRFLYL